MKSHKIFNSYRYGSVATPGATNACISLKMPMAICGTSLLILILMSSQMSVGQTDPSLVQTPNFSSSIFFTGKALEFAYEKPFAVIHKVSTVADKFTNNEVPCKSTNTTSMESQVPPAIYHLSQIIVMVPADKAGLILSQIPTDKREEILSQIPTDKRQEIVNNLIE